MRPCESSPLPRPALPAGRVAFRLGTLLLAATCAAAPPAPPVASAPAAARPATSRPASQSASSAAPALTAFQPGVRIDWRAPAVCVDTRVALRSGPLEFFACFPGREHESVLLIQATAVHVYQALGLIGLTPGTPPRWDEPNQAFADATGDLVDVSCMWEDAGVTRQVPAAEWMRAVEYGRPPLPRPWVFAGSLVRPDGSLAADASGAGVAVVDFADVLLAYSRHFDSHNEDLWVTANAAAIPPAGTPVTLVLRPAAAPSHRFALEGPGVCRVDGHFTAPEDFADLVYLQRRLKPDALVTVSVSGVLEADVAELAALLAGAGVPADALRWQREPLASQPASQPAPPHVPTSGPAGATP